MRGLASWAWVFLSRSSAGTAIPECKDKKKVETPWLRIDGRKERLRFELEARGSEAVEAAPQQAIDEHHDRRHDESGSKKQIEAAGIAGAANSASQACSPNNPPLKMKIFGDDAGVPRSA